MAQLAPGCGPISVEVPRAPCPVQGLAPRGPRDQFGLDPRFCLASLILVAFYWRRVFSIALSPASRPFPRFLPTWFSCFRGNLCPRYAQLDLAGFIPARSVVWHRFGRPISWAETSVVPSSSVWGFFPLLFLFAGICGIGHFLEDINHHVSPSTLLFSIILQYNHHNQPTHLSILLLS